MQKGEGQRAGTGDTYIRRVKTSPEILADFSTHLIGQICVTQPSLPARESQQMFTVSDAFSL